MGKKKTKGPKKPPKYPRIAAVALAAALSTTAACGDEYFEQGATCAVLGGLIAEHLVVDLGCTLQFSFLVDFGTACVANDPSDEDALGCLARVYELQTCPDFLPDACLLFTPRLQATVPPGVRGGPGEE